MGHRRIAAMYLPAHPNVPGLSTSTAVATLEVIGTSAPDHLIRGVVDNEVRHRLDRKERLKIVQKFAKTSRKGGL
jgi:hypothetical protein